MLCCFNSRQHRFSNHLSHFSTTKGFRSLWQFKNRTCYDNQPDLCHRVSTRASNGMCALFVRGTIISFYFAVFRPDPIWPSATQALQYLVLISEVEETEIFKICLEYWNSLAADLYRENPFSPGTTLPLSNADAVVPARRQLYLPILSKVRNA